MCVKYRFYLCFFLYCSFPLYYAEAFSIFGFSMSGGYNSPIKNKIISAIASTVGAPSAYYPENSGSSRIPSMQKSINKYDDDAYIYDSFAQAGRDVALKQQSADEFFSKDSFVQLFDDNGNVYGESNMNIIKDKNASVLANLNSSAHSGQEKHISLEEKYSHGFSILVGKQFGQNSWYEIETSRNIMANIKEDNADAIYGDLYSIYAMVNGYVSHRISNYLKPYIGAGIGVARFDLNDEGVSQSISSINIGAAKSEIMNLIRGKKTNMPIIYQFIGGIDCGGFFIDARFVASNNMKFEKNNKYFVDYKYKRYSVTFGWRFNYL